MVDNLITLLRGILGFFIIIIAFSFLWSAGYIKVEEYFLWSVLLLIYGYTVFSSNPNNIGKKLIFDNLLFVTHLLIAGTLIFFNAAVDVNGPNELVVILSLIPSLAIWIFKFTKIQK